MKIIKSQNEDTKLAIEQLKESIEEMNNIKLQLDLCQALAEKQSEEINYLNKKAKSLKRVRISSIIVGSSGILIGTLGYIFKNYDETKNIGNAFFVSGISLTTSSVLTLSFTFTF